VGCHKKWTFHFISVRRARTSSDFLWGLYHGQGAERHHSNFNRYGTLKDGHTVPVVSSIFSGACIYCIFWTFGCLNSNLNYGYIKYTSNSLEENTLRCETPETMHVILGHIVHLGTLSAHCCLDLYLRCCQRWPKKIIKWQKQGMGSWYMKHTKIYKVWHTKVLGHGCFTTKWYQKHEWLACLIIWSRWIYEDGLSKKRITNFQILASHRSQSSVSRRDDPTTSIGQ
jgi:hypothetical protein